MYFECAYKHNFMQNVTLELQEVINEGKQDGLESALRECVFLLKAQCVFIADNKGKVIFSKTKEEDFSRFSLASFSLNALHCLRSFSTMIEKNKSESLLFTGEYVSSYFILLSPSTVLGIIFSNEVPFGFIKLKTKKLMTEIQKLVGPPERSEKTLYLMDRDGSVLKEATRKH